jgi:threonine/homoserine/homoserine lactone efflux protein
MTLQSWLLYLNAVFLLSAIPGPNMTHIMTVSVRNGIWRTVPGMVGCLLALVALMGASALGLSAVLTASPTLFRVLKFAGAVYLVQMGVRAWLDRGSAPAGPDAAVPLAWHSTLGTSFLVGASNPKAIIFAASFLPQFINPTAPQAPQYGLLVATSAVVETLWYLIYASSGARLAVVLTRAVWRRRVQRFSGALFILFGFALLLHDPK